MEIEEHYGLLLGVHSPWEIGSVDLKLKEQQVDIVIEYNADNGPCPECGVDNFVDKHRTFNGYCSQWLAVLKKQCAESRQFQGLWDRIGFFT